MSMGRKKFVTFYSGELLDEPEITGDNEWEEPSDIIVCENGDDDYKMEELNRRWERAEREEEDLD
jgi:hypothetical protein